MVVYCFFGGIKSHWHREPPLYDKTKTNKKTHMKANIQNNACIMSFRSKYQCLYFCLCMCLCLCDCVCVHVVCFGVCMCACLCHRVLSFPFTAPWQLCQTRPHMICVCLWKYACVCAWVDTVFILLSNPLHLRSPGCSRVLLNGQSRPTKLAFGLGTELDA